MNWYMPELPMMLRGHGTEKGTVWYKGTLLKVP